MIGDGSEVGRLRFSADWIRGFASGPLPTVSIYRRESPGRRRIEAYLEHAYARAFDGRIGQHFPNLLGVENRHGEVTAAVGFRLARRDKPYLERYLDEPVEGALGRAFGAPVSRNRIAEVGNLAAHGQGASLVLFLAAANHLQQLGCTHAVATATRQLRRSFARVGFSTCLLGRADPARAGDGASWGSYYHRDPEVLAGSIAMAMPALVGMLGRGPSISKGQLQ